MNPDNIQANLVKSINQRKARGQDVSHSQDIYNKTYEGNPNNAPLPTNAVGSAPSVPSPMGAKAKSPASNIKVQPKVLSTSQTAPVANPVPPVTTPPATPVSPTTPNYGNGLYGQLIGQGVTALNKSAALTGQIEKAKQDVAGNPNYSLDTQVGRQGLIQQNIGTQASALAEQGQGYLAGAGYAKPQVSSYGQTAYNPVNNSFGTSGGDPLESAMSTYAQLAASGQGSQIPGAITSNPELMSRLTQEARKIDPNFDWNTAGARGGAVGQFESQIQGIKSKLAAAGANFENLKGYTSNIPGNVPIIKGLQQLLGTTAQGSTAVAGFQSQLQAVRQAYTDLVGGDATQAIPDNVTGDQLSQIQKTLEDTANNNLTNLTTQEKSAQTTGTSSGNQADPLGIR